VAKRNQVPPMRPRDVMFSSTPEPASAPPEPPNVKSSAYLRPDQLVFLDEQRAAHRAAGRRTVSASDLIRGALDLAKQYPVEWEQIVAEQAR
jgi:hypothetical protein